MMTGVSTVVMQDQRERDAVDADGVVRAEGLDPVVVLR